MKHFLRSILALTALVYFFSGVGDIHGIGEGENINMAVSPIRDEFIVSTGTSITRQVTFYNNAPVPYNVYITTEDCVPGTNYGTPLCRPVSAPGIDTTKSSTWITTSDPGLFTVPANSNKVISYTVTVPSNASPGGHYGAIFFNNPDTDPVAGSTVKMNRRIGMLYLMTVPGEIVVDTIIGDILIDTGPGGGVSSPGPSSLLTLFSAPADFFDVHMNRLLMVFSDPDKLTSLMDEINPLWERPTLPTEDFLVTLKVPVENSGNTHVLPTGKIYLYDGETRLERIGKESIVDENGVYLGEKIVDYLPINDEGGNVLPGTDRIFNVDWAGFAFDDYDPLTGKRIVGFEAPSAYFSRMAGNDTLIVFPWERLGLKSIERMLQAKVEITYKNPLTNLDEAYTMELPVPIEYKYIAKTLNWSMLILIFLFTLLVWRILRRPQVKSSRGKKNAHHLENEIDILEQARATMQAKKKSIKTKSPVKKEVKSVKETPKNLPEKKVSRTKTPEIKMEDAPVKKAPLKKVAPKKIATPRAKKAPSSETKA